jgi:hypothetical protein
MFTRHVFAAAVMMAATFSAQADVISITPDLLATSTVSTDAADTSAQFYLVRGVEGLYMLASRLPGETVEAGTPAVDTPAISLPISVGADAPVVTAPVAVDLPAVDAEIGEVPEPTSIALMLAGMIGAAGFTRSRKQG